jgi:hypothetical protein
MVRGAGGGWQPCDVSGIAKFDFAGSEAHEVALHAGDEVRVLASSTKGWFRGVALASGRKGIFPQAYVELSSELVPASAYAAGAAGASRAQGGGGGGDGADALEETVRAVLNEWARREPDGASELLSDATGAIAEWSAALWGPEQASSEALRVLLRGLIAQTIELAEARAAALAGGAAAPALLPRSLRSGAVLGIRSASLVALWVAHERLQQALYRGSLDVPQVLRSIDAAAQAAPARLAGVQQRLYRLEWRRHKRELEVRERDRSRAAAAAAAQGSGAQGSGGKPRSPSSWHGLIGGRLRQRSATSDPSSSGSGEAARASRLGGDIRGLLLDGASYDLFLRFERSQLPVAFPVTVHLQLYSDALRSFVSEEFAVALSRAGEPLRLAETRFTALRRSQLGEGLLLVATIWRYGPLLVSSAEAASAEGVDPGAFSLDSNSATYRRPVGAAAWRLSPRLSDLMADVVQLPSDLVSLVQHGRDEYLAHKLHRLVSQLGAAADPPSPPTPGAGEAGGAAGDALNSALLVSLGVEPSGAAANSGASSTSGGGGGSSSSSPGVTCKLFVGDGCYEAGAPRNDLYVTLQRGVFLQDKKRAARNVEVRVVLLGEGERGAWVPLLALSRGSGEQKLVHRSAVYYHDNTPLLTETITVRVPPSIRLARCHLLFLMFHASTTPGKTHPFSFTWLPLCDASGVLLQDGAHQLQCFRPFKNDITLELASNAARYLRGNSSLLAGRGGGGGGGGGGEAGAGQGDLELAARPGETLTVETCLCSTVETNRAALDPLLSWDTAQRRLPAEQLAAVLDYNAEVMEPRVAMVYLRRVLAIALSALDHAHFESKDERLAGAAFGLLASALARGADGDATFRAAVQAFVADVLPSCPGDARVFQPVAQLLRSGLQELASGESVGGGARGGAPLRLVRALPALLELAAASHARAAHASHHRAAPASPAPAPGARGRKFRDAVLAILDLLADVTARSDAEAEPKEAEQQLLEETQLACLDAAGDCLQAGWLQQSPFAEGDSGDVARLLLEAVRLDSPAVNRAKLALMARMCASTALRSPAERVKVMAAFVRTVQEHLLGGAAQAEAEQRAMQRECAQCVRALLLVLEEDRELLESGELLDGSERQIVARRHGQDVWAASILLPELFRAAARVLVLAAAPLPPPGQLEHAPPSPPLAAAPDEQELTTTLLTSAFSVVLDMDAQQRAYFLTAAFPAASPSRRRSPALEAFMGDAMACCVAVLSSGQAAGPDGPGLPLYRDSWQLLSVGAAKAMLRLLEWFAPYLCASHQHPHGQQHPHPHGPHPRKASPSPRRRHGSDASVGSSPDPTRTRSRSGSSDRRGGTSGSEAPPAPSAPPLGPLWVSFFQAALLLLNVPALTAREQGSPALRAAEGVTEMTVRLVELIEACWRKLDGGVGFLARPLAQPLLLTCTSQPLEERSGSVPLARRLFLDLAAEEVRRTGAVHDVEHETIVFVEWAAAAAQQPPPAAEAEAEQRAVARERSAAVGARTLELLSVHLRSMARASADEGEVERFLRRVAQLFKLTRRLDSLPADAAHEEDRAHALIALVQYLRKLHHRGAALLKHVEQLSQLHEQCGNAAEAASALLLEAELLGEAEAEAAPAEAACGAARLALLGRAAALLERGRLWEKALAVLDEVRALERERFAFDCAAQAAEQQARLLRAMHATRGARYFPSFFRVSFRAGAAAEPAPALLLDEEVRGRTYVYKGADVESLADFCARLAQRYPAVPLLQGGAAAAAAASAADRVEVQTVVPCSAFDALLLGAAPPQRTRLATVAALLPKLVPSDALRQREHAAAVAFVAVRSFRKRAAKSGNEFLDGWAEYRVAHTGAPLPGLARRAAVVREETLELDPLRLAVKAIHAKNCELWQAAQLHHGLGRGQAAQGLTMLLSGVLDAAVNGGVLRNYGVLLARPPLALVAKDYPEILAAYCAPSEAEEWVEALRDQLTLQVATLDEALHLHGASCADSVLPMHQHLAMRLEQLKKQVPTTWADLS